MRSLRLRLTLLALILAMVGFFSAYYMSKKDADQYIDSYEFAHMDGQSVIIAGLWEAGKGCAKNRRPDFSTFSEDFFDFTGLAYEIRCKESKYTGRSAIFPKFETPLPEDPDFYDYKDDIDGDPWLVVSRETATAHIIVTMASTYKPNLWEFMKTREFLILLTGVLLCGLLLYFLTGLVLRPITKLRMAAESSGDSLEVFNPPQELSNLKTILLLLKNKQAEAETSNTNLLDKERHFTANAAHELLTPLSAIKTEVQLQQRLTKDKKMKSWLGELLTRVNRATHTVDQLMTLARLDPDDTPGEKTPIDAAMLITEITEDYQEKWQGKFINLSLNFDDNNAVMAYPGLTDTLLRNLISNACKYTPVEGNIKIETAAQDQSLLVKVSNSSERLPEYLLDHMFERFVRGPHAVETGSGLGLAIAKRIAELQGTTLFPVIGKDKKSISFEFSLPLA